METKKISPNFLLKNMGKNKMKGSATVIAIVIVLVAMGSSVITWMYAKNFKMESSPISDENKKTSMILTENAASSTALMSGVFYGKSFAGTRLNGAENQVVLVDDGKEFVIDQSLDPVLEKTEDIESSEGAQFGNLQFSPKGRFLAYDYSGWDVSGTKVYDVREKKSANLINDISEGAFVSFSKEDKYATVWLASSEEELVKVYVFDTETWKRTDVLGNDTESKKFMDVDVQYDPERNVIMIELYGTQDDVEAVRVLEYELETGKLIVIE